MSESELERLRQRLTDEWVAAAQMQMERFFSDLDEESDRGMVLSAAAYFDKVMTDCLALYLKDAKQSSELLGSSRELGTYSARSKLCFALRIISASEFRALSLLGRIRNDFAHKVLVSLEDPSIRDKLFSFGEVVLGDTTDVWEKTQQNRERQLFSIATFCLNELLWLRPYDVSLHVQSYPELIPYHLDHFTKSDP